MKKFIKWKILIITCLACFLPIIAGIIFWDRLPQEMAIHFDIKNNPDNYAPKGFAVFGLPCLMVLLQIICCIINDVNAKKFGGRKKFEMVTKWIIPVMSLLLYFLTLAYNLKAPIDIRKCYDTDNGKVNFTSSYQEYLTPGENRKFSVSMRGWDNYDKFEFYRAEARDY